mmetsp:Transcript_77122/g.223171  ORF Transcript_77122/g.223171 Transcript_77122/m.223171 type:complete len:939 (+) Transcript_77122:112-2928(+)
MEGLGSDAALGDAAAGEEATDEVPPGLGEEDFPGFPADHCPAELPDLGSHHSALADVLKQRPALYGEVRERTTARGVGLARCIKTGIDNRGHPMVKTIGLVAGDADCYDVFRELFDPVIAQHMASPVPEPQVIGFPGEGSGIGQVDGSERFIVGVEIRMSRCLKDFRFPPAMSREDFGAVESRLAGALLQLPPPWQGSYYPLRGSSSFPEIPGGMDKVDEVVLNSRGLLFEAPDSAQRLCTGAGRHWPHGRGIFANQKKDLCVWINELEHVRVMMKRPGDSLEDTYQELVGFFEGFEHALKDGRDNGTDQTAFALSRRLGYLNTNPTNLGSGLHASVTVNLPLLANTQGEALGSKWARWCSKQRVQVRSVDYMFPGRLELSAGDPLDRSPVLVLRRLSKVAAVFIQMELRLEAGHPIDDLAGQDIDLGLGGDDAVVRPATGGAPPKTIEVSSALAVGDDAAATAAILFEGILASVVRDLSTPAGVFSVDIAEEVKEAVPFRPNSVLTEPSRPDTGCSAWTVNASSNASVNAQHAEDMVATMIEVEMVTAVEAASPQAIKSAGMKVVEEEPAPELTELLLKAQQALVQANNDGTLDRALEEVVRFKDQEQQRRPVAAQMAKGAEATTLPDEFELPAVPEEVPTCSSVNMSALRSRTCQALLRASRDGSLEKTLDEMVPEPEVDELRGRLASTLFGLVDAGELMGRFEESLGQQSPEAPAPVAVADGADQAPDTLAPAARAAVAAADVGAAAVKAEVRPVVPHVPVAPPLGKKMPMGAAGFRRGRMAHWLLQAVSERDRRIGELTALVRETEVRLIQQDEHCRHIEDLVAATRGDLAHVELDIEWHRRALEAAEGRTAELMAGQRKLRDELDVRRHEIKRVELDSLPAGVLASPYTARSDLSTITGGTTWSSFTLQSPRPQPVGAVLEPLPTAPWRGDQR